MTGNLLQQAALATGLSRPEISRILVDAPQRYKVYEIEKRCGCGTRTIAQPSSELKMLQRFLIDHLLRRLPVSTVATAYRDGQSIRDNAQIHVNSTCILKLDFENFFGSITASDWKSYCSDMALGLKDVDVDFCVRTLFWRRRGSDQLVLSIGAPSSPILSNVMMYHFDIQVQRYCQKKRLRFSRYADDITVSGRTVEALGEVQALVSKVLGSLSYPKLRLNESKTTLVTKRYRRIVTGLVLTNDGAVSIGRDKKRQLSARIHSFVTGRLDVAETLRLRGELAFVNAAEPEFLHRMMEKYGLDTIRSIQCYTPRRLDE